MISTVAYCRSKALRAAAVSRAGALGGPNGVAVAKYAAQFPEVRLVTVEDVYGGWEKVQAEHFAEGGLLDKVFLNQ